mmetsp:Transcript_53/g.143  ORF Transcript_53/g.143 Transcript_53/m.143 type:complete len:345 (-) Transcript_53:278-1312(-)
MDSAPESAKALAAAAMRAQGEERVLLRGLPRGLPPRGESSWWELELELRDGSRPTLGTAPSFSSFTEPASSSKSSTAVSLMPAMWSEFWWRSISRLEFISSWKSSRGKSLSSLPKGFSSWLAVKFKENMPKMGTTVKTKAHALWLMSSLIMTGVRTVWRTSSMLMSCAYGKGKRVSVIFFALSRFTNPRESVWYTRDRIGGGIFRTPLSRFFVMSVWIKCKITSTLLKSCFSLHSLRCKMVVVSKPLMSMVGMLMSSPLSSAISSSALPWHKLMSRMIVWRKSMTSCLLDSSAPLVKVTQQLTESNHSPRIWCSRPVPSQNLDRACLLRKLRRRVSTPVTAAQL